MMLIVEARRMAVGEKVGDLDVVVTTAGATSQVDKTLPKKQKNQQWQQKLGLTDTSGHIWAIVTKSQYDPIIKSNELMIKDATIDEFMNKGGEQEKRLLIDKYERKVWIGEPPEEKSKFEGILDPLIETILEKYNISAIDALWPCTHKNKKAGIITTNWIIYHRYCEQIAAKAGIVFEKPELIVNDKETNTVVLLVTGHLGYVHEWSYGEASPATTYLPYFFAMAEKRAKDRVILKLVGFHGMVYSDVEQDWKGDK